MRQDARRQTLPRRHPRARRAPAADRAANAEQLCFVFRDDVIARIGPPALPPSPDVDWHERGIARELAGDLEGAIADYGRALLARGPSAQVAFDLAHALAAAGERDRAIERYRQAIELDAARADAWNNLGDLLVDRDDIAGGVEAFCHAIALDPTDAAPRFNLATTLDAAGQLAAARPHYRRFLALADGDADRLAHAARRLAAP